MKSKLNFSLLVLLFIFASCGKNQVIGNPEDQAVFSAKSEARFFTFLDNDQLRSHALNALVIKKLEEHDFNQEAFIQTHLQLDSQSFREFTQSKISHSKNYARLFVSYSDRTEVYYIPEKTDLATIEKTLGLDPDKYRYFSWLIKDDNAMAGKDYVLVNLNHSDLMENDKFFFEEEINISSEEELVEVINGATLNVEIDYQMLKQSLQTVTANGTTMKCNRAIAEATGCSCEANIQMPSNLFSPVSLSGFDLIDFDFKINDSFVKFGQMNFAKIEDNKISFNVDFIEHYTLTPTFQLVKKHVAVTEVVHGFNYMGNCVGRDQATIQRKIQSKLTVKYKILGRGERLKQIKL